MTFCFLFTLSFPIEARGLQTPQNFFLINLQLVGWVNVQIDLWGSLVQDGVVAVRYVSVVVRNKIEFFDLVASYSSSNSITPLLFDIPLSGQSPLDPLHFETRSGLILFTLLLLSSIDLLRPLHHG